MLPRLEKNVYISMVFLSIRVVFCTKCIKFDGFHPFRSVKFQGLLSVQRQILSCFSSYYNVSFYNVSLCHRELFEFSNHKNRLRLGTFSCLARSLHLRAGAHHWRVSAFCVIGNSSEFPITQKMPPDIVTRSMRHLSLLI